MLISYKHQSYFSQIVSKKAKKNILFIMKNSNNNNIILGCRLQFYDFGFSLSNKENVKVEIFLEQREVAFLPPSKICKNLNFFLRKFKFSQIFLSDKNANYLYSKIISTLKRLLSFNIFFGQSLTAKYFESCDKKYLQFSLVNYKF